MVGGFPFGILKNDSIKITRGIVSSLSGSNNITQVTVMMHLYNKEIVEGQ